MRELINRSLEDDFGRGSAAARLIALAIWVLLAFAVPISVALLSSCSAAATPQVRKATYACNDGKSFTIQRDGKNASLEYFGEHYSLSRRPSSVGVKYASPEATLIIDGDFAAFVTESLVDFERCYEAK